jgi:outer membrane protein OmpU
MNNNKEINMINLKKVGLTALAGSLAAVTANAGEISVSGAANVTYVTKSGNNANSIGTDKDVKFSGSGELDNGWTVSFHTTMTDAYTVSSSATVIGMGSMGSIGFGSGGGTNVAGAYDETYPRAYEENSDAGGQSAANYVGNWADDQAIVYQWPGMDVMGVSLSGGLEYSLQADGSATPNDGNVVANQNTWGSGYGIGLTADTNMGLVAGIYYAERENKNHSAANDVTDEWNGSYFVNYSAGPVSIGYQEAYVDSGLTSATNATNAAKTVGTSSGAFEAQNMSIAFNVNDDLSISYAEAEETYDTRDMLTSTTETADVTQQSESLQIAYSMGSMSIKAYTTEITNPNYDEDADNLKKNEIAIGLAF